MGLSGKGKVIVFLFSPKCGLWEYFVWNPGEQLRPFIWCWLFCACAWSDVAWALVKVIRGQKSGAISRVRWLCAPSWLQSFHVVWCFCNYFYAELKRIPSPASCDLHFLASVTFGSLLRPLEFDHSSISCRLRIFLKCNSEIFLSSLLYMSLCI